MKKNLIKILIIIVIAIVVIFVFSLKSKHAEKTIVPAQPTEESTPTEKPATTKEKTEEPENSPLNSLSLGGSYQCTYTIENDMQVTTYVKDGKTKTEIPLENGDTNVSLFADNKVYQWSEKEKQGVVMAVEEAKKQSGTEVQDPVKYLNEIKNKYKPDCKNINVSDGLFAVPTDVQFQDLSKSLNQ